MNKLYELFSSVEAVGPDAVDVLDSPRKLGRKEIVSEWICVTKTTSRRTDYSRVTRQLLNEWGEFGPNLQASGD